MMLRVMAVFALSPTVETPTPPLLNTQLRCTFTFDWRRMRMPSPSIAYTNESLIAPMLLTS